MVCNAAYLHGAIELFLSKAGERVCKEGRSQAVAMSPRISAGIAGNFETATRFIAAHASRQHAFGHRWFPC